jgi:exopolysaccharide biosynthesis polyprenyl glycosylphosphotransferase
MVEEQGRNRARDVVLLDATLTVVAMLAAYTFRRHFVEAGGSLLTYVGLLGVILPLWIFLLTFFGAYRTPQSASMAELAWSVMRAIGAGILLLLTFLFIVKVQYVSRVIVMAFAIGNLVALIGVRAWVVWGFRRALSRGESFRHVLVIGSGNRAKLLARHLRTRHDTGVQIVGYLDPDPSAVGKVIYGAPVLGTLDDITSTLKAHVVDEVILAIPRGLMSQAEKVVLACEEEGVRIRLMADLFTVNVARMTLDGFDGLPLLTLEPVAQEEWQLLVKRMADVAVSVLLLPIVLPVMAVIAAAIRLDSPGPVFFRQERVGQSKRRFLLFKFRTMVDGGERLQASLEALNEADGPVFKIADDPRVTRVGRFLRRMSLDELPQLLNVLRGEMSLVGPRPLPLRDVNLFDRGIQRRRFSVKPGITGLWQISGRSNLAFSKWLELDLWYIEHWSLWLDAKILARTVPAVVKAVGAH